MRKKLFVVRWKDERFLQTDKKDGKILLVSEQPEKIKKFSLREIEKDKFGHWVPEEEVQLIGTIISDDLVKWKGELLTVGGQKENEILLGTMQPKKAKKLGIPEVNKGEWEIWVPVDEVEIIGHSERYWGTDVVI